jgi:signal transduction histidine kinase
MPLVNLKKTLDKQKLQPLLQNLIYGLNTAIAIEDVNGQILLSIGEQTTNHRYPILVLEEIIGWVVAEKQGSVLADLLSLLAKQEAEKKELARELLERYQEIDLFEDISTQLTSSLETRQIAQLVLQEMNRLIESSAGIILLLKEDGTEFETIAEFGLFSKDCPDPNQSIIGKIVQSGRAELLNHVAADPRSTEQITLQALICVPLKAKERVLGALAIGTQTPDAYTAEHLKLVGIFASQTAVAIEKALLYEQSCQTAVEAKAQAERLQQALQDLQLAQTQLVQSEKMSSLGQLIAGIAHEINNPVNFICGNLKYVAEYTHDLLRLLQGYQQFVPMTPPELAEEIDAIDLDFLMQDLPKILNSMKLGTHRIVEIVQSLKNFSRHDEAKMKQVNIHDGIDGTLMILWHRLKATGTRPAIEVIKDYADIPLIECYAGQLNQVFMNILANAIDALEETLLDNTQTNHFTPTITIHTQTDNHSVVIRVADNGAGIPEEIMSRIYDPFFTTKEIGKGTGLGMSISQKIIVERHRGILKCRSQPGEGTEFWIQIPVTCSPAIAFEAQTLSKQTLTKSDPKPIAPLVSPSESLYCTEG